MQKSKQKFGKLIKIITVELTYRCNLNCTICYMQNGLYENKDDIKLNVLKNFLDKISPKTEIVLTGGEPFLYKGIYNLLDHLKKRKTRILTNGTLIDFNNLEKLKSTRNLKFEISLNGNKKQDNLIRGNVYQKTLDSIKKLKENNIEVIINSVITKENYTDLKEIALIAKKLDTKLNLQHYLFDEMIKNPQNNIDNHNFNIKKLIQSIKEAKKIIKNIDLIPKTNIEKFYSNKVDFYSNKICKKYLSDLRIKPDGTISRCFVKNIGNIADKNLSLDIDLRSNFQNKNCIGCCKI